MTLLIAEDSDRIRRMLKDMVSSFFTEIYECSDGQKAFELYSEKKPDWILMDILMPVMDGIEATKRITEMNPDAKVIIVTNFDSNIMRKVASDVGAVKYVLKENSTDIIELFEQQIN